MESASVTPNKRSGFITGLAWTFIALAAFMTLIAVMQNIVMALFFPAEDMQSALREAGKTLAMPPVVLFMFENFRLIVGSFLALSALTLAAAIGLLMRHNWARVAFVWIMAVGVVANLAGVALPFFISDWLPPMPTDTPSEFLDHFKLVLKIITVVSVVTALVSAWLCAWIMKRLMAEDVRQEFQAA